MGKVENTIVVGYVVKNKKNNKFLSRSMKFINQDMGINFAYVHEVKELLKGGDWVSSEVTIYPACYDSKEELTKTCEPLSCEEFFKIHALCSLRDEEPDAPLYVS